MHLDLWGSVGSTAVVESKGEHADLRKALCTDAQSAENRCAFGTGPLPGDVQMPGEGTRRDIAQKASRCWKELVDLKDALLWMMGAPLPLFDSLTENTVNQHELA